MTALSVRGLTVLRGRRTVLEDVSFSAAAGAMTAILGVAGAGKTSLLAAIAGLLPAERGAVFCDSRDVTALSPRRRGVGFLAPGSVLPAARSTGAAVARLAKRGTRDEVAGLIAPDLADLPPAQLSHGQAFMAMTAARLVQPGPVILVDEAGMGLDDFSRASLLAALHQAASAGRSVVVATRSAAMALQADHLVLLAGGQVIQAGTPASVYAEPRSVVSAHLTGLANIVSGRIRELRPQSFIWAAAGRYLQAAEPESPRPTLGTEVTLCLRPERIALLASHERADNMLEGEITAFRTCGPLLHVRARTALGDLMIAPPSWRPTYYPAIGQQIRVAWAPDAAWVLP